jgi:hypothetical protein
VVSNASRALGVYVEAKFSLTIPVTMPLQCALVEKPHDFFAVETSKGLKFKKATLPNENISAKF